MAGTCINSSSSTFCYLGNGLCWENETFSNEFRAKNIHWETPTEILKKNNILP